MKFQNAEESAATDHLTGIPNARALDIHLSQELERAARSFAQVKIPNKCPAHCSPGSKFKARMRRASPDPIACRYRGLS
jgi:GGDEF domain-containing protein